MQKTTVPPLSELCRRLRPISRTATSKRSGAGWRQHGNGLEESVKGYDQSRKSAEKFIAMIDKYQNFDTMTTTMLNEFVEKIFVHARDQKGRQDTGQEIEIYFNFVGRYTPPHFGEVTLTPEEQEELRKKEECREQAHRAYLKRKANGTQKRYEDRIKAAKKTEMDAKNAAICAEDMARELFTPAANLPRQGPQRTHRERFCADSCTTGNCCEETSVT